MVPGSTSIAYGARDLGAGHAAVADHTGAVVGAVGLSGPSDRITATAVRRLGGDLRATAAKVSAGLGARAA
jgi:DNA-binding IclR family transcriptional regulator